MFCDRCGAALQSGARFCPSCGVSVNLVPIAAGESRLSRHLRLLGILWMALSALHVLGAFFTWIAGRFILPSVMRGGGGIPGFVPPLVMSIGYFLLVLSIAGLATGWGLLQRETWARTLALVMGFIVLLKAPLGTALGIYTLWVLLPAQADEEYRRLSRAA